MKAYECEWVSENFSAVSNLLQPPGYTVHGILQAKILEWVAFPFSRGYSHPRYQTQVFTLQVNSLPAESQEKLYESVSNSMSDHFCL